MAGASEIDRALLEGEGASGADPVLRMGWGPELPFWPSAPHATAGQELDWVLAGSVMSSIGSEQSSF